MDKDCIFVLLKGDERVSLVDNKSLIDLANALFVLDCNDQISKKKISGNKQSLDIYEISFMDTQIRVIGMTDVEKITHWMLSFGCTNICISKVREEEQKGEGNDKGRKDCKKAE